MRVVTTQSVADALAWVARRGVECDERRWQQCCFVNARLQKAGLLPSPKAQMQGNAGA